MNKLKLKLLGNIQIFFNDKEITNLLSGKSAALLIYLAFYPNIKHKRKKIIDLFWANSPDSSAKYNLRYNLWSINKIIKDFSIYKIISSSNTELYINPELSIELDIDYLNKLNNELEEDICNIDDLILKKDKFKELFLDGIYLKECFEFNDWVYNQREEFQKIYSKILKTLLKSFQKNEKFNSSIEILKELINLNPYNEDNYIEIIKEFLNIQDKKNALVYYNKCINIFREELNISPTEYLIEWGETIKKSFILKNTNNYQLNIFLKNNVKNPVITIECFPSKIEYSFLFELSEILLKNCKINNKKILNDLSYINPFIENDMPVYFINSDTYKIRLFNSLIFLMNLLCSKNNLIMEIKNFHFIDGISFEFFKYLVYSKKIKGDIYLTNTLKCEELLELEKYITIYKE